MSGAVAERAAARVAAGPTDATAGLSAVDWLGVVLDGLLVDFVVILLAGGACRHSGSLAEDTSKVLAITQLYG